MNRFSLSILVRTSLSSNKSKFISTSSRWYCKNEDESKSEETKIKNEETVTREPKERSKASLTKLNSLLKEMIEASSQKAPSIELAKPKARLGKVRKMVENEKPAESPKTGEQNIVAAVKEVAETIGGNTKETESELLKKLLGYNEVDKTDTITSLSDIFKGMKIDRSPTPAKQTSRSEQVRQILGQSSRAQQSRQERIRSKPAGPIKRQKITKLDVIDLYGSKPLGIFTGDPKEYTEHVKNRTWEALRDREMKLSVTHPPSNYFQEHILWTEQGKLWKFPIDNEQGLEEEKNISFAEHIFLDKHLEPWCPPKGPIRHFMELVCVGLSKNSYLTANAKKEHIEWYRNYFEEKRQLLKDVGAALNEYEPRKEIESK